MTQSGTPILKKLKMTLRKYETIHAHVILHAFHPTLKYAYHRHKAVPQFAQVCNIPRRKYVTMRHNASGNW